MKTKAPDTSPVEEPGPTDFQDPLIRRELARAAVWLGLAVAIALAAFLAQPLLLIIGGLVFASMLDGGARLLGRVLPIPRGFRLALVCVAAAAFLIWIFMLAGSQLAAQVETMRAVVTDQLNRIMAWTQNMGITDADTANSIGEQLVGSVGKLTSAVGTALGAVSSIALIVVIGIFVAIDPRLYERGIAWMLPLEKRDDFYLTTARMAYTMRRLMAGRLLGMAVEGVGTWILLSIGGVPMAALLGVLTGLLAFLPNIGAIISGILTILVGFSAGVDTGLWAIGVYLVVQTIDGYVIVPMVAKRAVDLAPALVLSAQLLFGTLFGILGLTFADPIVAMLKVMLERRAENAADKATEAD
ncbi:MAG: AI-2E family transporter [Sphingomonadaceae bacterium]